MDLGTGDLRNGNRTWDQGKQRKRDRVSRQFADNISWPLAPQPLPLPFLIPVPYVLFPVFCF
jgi:hypothetical protein